MWVKIWNMTLLPLVNSFQAFRRSMVPLYSRSVWSKKSWPLKMEA